VTREACATSIDRRIWRRRYASEYHSRGRRPITLNSPHKAVLFADVCDSTSIYETLGDTRALALINRLFRKLEERIGTHSGALAKTLGDGIVCHFPSPEAAFHTACEMQSIVLDGAMPRQPKLSIKIGFTYGPVVPKGTDVYGDTVNVCARLVSLAAAGQVLTTRETVDALPEGLRGRCRQLYPLKVKGRTHEITVCDVLWHPDPDITATDDLRPKRPRAGEYVCKLVYAGGTFVVTPEGTARLGRDKDNDLHRRPVSERDLSSHRRQHARSDVEARGGAPWRARLDRPWRLGPGPRRARPSLPARTPLASEVQCTASARLLAGF
jgi:class 3 adenylate cyclase